MMPHPPLLFTDDVVLMASSGAWPPAHTGVVRGHQHRQAMVLRWKMAKSPLRVRDKLLSQV